MSKLSPRIFLLLLAVAPQVCAQTPIEDPGWGGGGSGYTVTISGPTTANVGESKGYTAEWRDLATNYLVFPEGGTATWLSMRGSVTISNEINSSVQWTTSGLGSVSYEYESWSLGYYYASLPVTISSSGPSVPNTTFTLLQNCNSTVVTRNTSPPAGITWYWQTSSTGTSTTLGINASITRTTSSVLYLRARNSSGTWSTTSQSVGTVNIISTPPAVPASATDKHTISNVATPVTLSVSAVSGATSYRWYLTASGGTAITGATTASYSPSLSTTTNYYVESVNGNCASTSRRQVIGYVHPLPTITTTANTVGMGSEAVVSVSGYTYDTYQWYRNGSIINGATGASHTTKLAGYYTIKVSKGNSGAITSTAGKTIQDFSSQLQNYIASNTVLVNGIVDPSTINALTADENSQVIQYFDGLGRPMQTVLTQGSPLKKDIVQPHTYDAFGRGSRAYLPYVSTETKGYYKDNALSQQQTFYNPNGTLPGITGDIKPYSETIFEPSPLDRVLKQGSPGITWQPDNDNSYSSTDHSIKFGYDVNTIDEVLLWKHSYWDAANPFGKVNSGTGTTPQYYEPDQLYKNKTKDENGHEVIEFKDRQGKVLLKKVQADSEDTWAQTYYIYDYFDQLICIIPPEATKLLTKNPSDYFGKTDNEKNKFLDTWAFRYSYDGRRRMIMKQIPGAGPVYMVYDKRDRLVMTQDANQRAGTTKYWSFTKYDALNRPVSTGIYTSSNTLSSMQAAVDSYYANLSPTKAWFDSYVGNTAGNVHGYNNYSFPQETNANNYLSVTYYDNYGFKTLWPNIYNYLDENLSKEVNGVAYNQPDAELIEVKGQVTGMKIKVLDGGITGGQTWLKTINFYDDDYRLIQIVSDNNKSGISRLTNLYDFTGKILKTKANNAKGAIVWRDIVNATVSGEVLTRTTTNAGAASVQVLPTNTDGWLEVVCATTNVGSYLGFNDTNPDAGFSNINYAFHFSTSTVTRILENGIEKAVFQSSPGDRLRIARMGTQVRYYKNNVEITLTQASTPSTTLLMVDVSLNSPSLTGVSMGSNSAVEGVTNVIVNTFAYDHAGRRISTWHKLNNGPEILLAKNEYNELGQLITKKLHSKDQGATFKQHINYRYNIRSWLTRINNSDLNLSDGGPTDYFGMEFGYNNDLGVGTFTPQYNGNISATKWSANLGLALSHLNEPTERSYTFVYDPLNRVREAKYGIKVNNWSSSMEYREAIGYDLNGNILSLRRNNEKGSPMDWLEYNYGDGINKSDQLKSVTDYGIHTKGFRDRNSSGDDYTYDGNGNLVQDKNKEIEETRYNSLNFTEEINKTTGEKVKYIYDADGIKLAEEIYPPGAQAPVKRIDYVGQLVYENDTLKFIVHEEGKVVIPKDQSEPEYQYQVKDNVGNVRLTFTAREETEEFQATMEDTGIANYSNPRVQEMETFGNLFETEIRNVNQWLNHTSSTIGNAIYLDGSEGKVIGPHSVLKVYPGDTIKMEVYGKFQNKSSHNNMPLVALFGALTNPVQTATIGFESGVNFSPSSFDGLIPFLGGRGNSSDAPAAYLNYILFDRNFNAVDMGFDRIDESAGFDALQEATVSFDKLMLERTIDRVGYLYVFVSNESEGTRVWMDDLKIMYIHSPIVQFEDYYPFGLSHSETAFERENEKYAGMVTTDGTGLKDLGFRQYDAALGRFQAIDPLAELQSDQSSYQYAGNNPVSQIDLLGLEADEDDANNNDKEKTRKPKRKKRIEKRVRNSEKIKVHNGYEPKQQRRNGQSANQRKRQPAHANRREQRREERAKAKAKNNNGGAQASGISGNTNGYASSNANLAQQVLTNMLMPGQWENRYDNSEERDDVTNTLGNANSKNQPAFFASSMTPPVLNDDNDQRGSASLMASAALSEQVTDIEQYREYVYRNHSNNEARALYARMLVSRNYNYQSSRLKDNLAAVSSTATSEDEILDPQQQDPKTSTPAEALAAIPENGTLEQSTHFPNVDPNDFLDQLRARVTEGGHEGTNQGAGTNFCWAAAIAKYVYDKDPKGMVDAMIGLYENGTFEYDNNNGGMNVPEASQEAREAIGSATFDNNQDEEMGQKINELDQMLFMTLADHYEESLNQVNQDYDPGDEEGFWASGVLSKATKIWEDFGFDVEVTGADVKVPGFTMVFNVFDVQEAMETKDVVLYVNSDKFKRDDGINVTATHYIHVISIEQVGDKYVIKYWDYGKEQEPIKMSADQFSSAVYGMIEITRANE